MCKWLFEYVLSLLWGMGPAADLLDRRVILGEDFGRTATLAASFYIPANRAGIRCSDTCTSLPLPLSSVLCVCCLKISHPHGTKWYLIVVLICLSLTSDFGHLFMCVLAFVQCVCVCVCVCVCAFKPSAHFRTGVLSWRMTSVGVL